MSRCGESALLINQTKHLDTLGVGEKNVSEHGVDTDVFVLLLLE